VIRALTLTGPGRAEVQQVEAPRPGPGDVLVEVHRVGVCGTDVELFDGDMAYFESGRARYPLRPGHEWCGVVAGLGAGTDPAWLGARVTGDTMLRCGRCDRCLAGHGHVCRDLVEVGISMGFAGALAERLVVPSSSLVRLPETVDDAAGALVEPGGNAWRAASAALAGGPDPADARVLVWGPGSIGLLTAAFAKAAGAQVHLLGLPGPALGLAAAFGVDGAWTRDSLPDLAFTAVVDATGDADVPAAAVDLVEPAGRVVLIGLAGRPSLLDTRRAVLRDLTVVGLLSGSPGLRPAVEHYADGRVRPQPLVAATVGLDRAADVLRGWHPGTPGTKIHIDPRR
jgi:2-desacetyl-2-hydroxyethyl bacteriochlorophyllide A dehydrogenase